MYSFYQALLIAAASAKRPSGGAAFPGIGGEVYDFSIVPRASMAGFIFKTNGDLQTITTDLAGAQTNTTVGTWLLSGASTDYAVRVSKVSGHDLSSGTMGSWTAVSTDQSYYYTVPGTGYGSKYGVFTVEIRRVSDSVVVVSESIILSANVEV